MPTEPINSTVAKNKIKTTKVDNKQATINAQTQKTKELEAFREKRASEKEAAKWSMNDVPLYQSPTNINTVPPQAQPVTPVNSTSVAQQSQRVPQGEAIPINIVETNKTTQAPNAPIPGSDQAQTISEIERTPNAPEAQQAEVPVVGPNGGALWSPQKVRSYSDGFNTNQKLIPAKSSLTYYNNDSIYTSDRSDHLSIPYPVINELNEEFGTTPKQYGLHFPSVNDLKNYSPEQRQSMIDSYAKKIKEDGHDMNNWAAAGESIEMIDATKWSEVRKN